MGLIFLLLFSAVHDISRTFDFLTPYNSHCDPLWWGGGFFLSIYSTVHEIYRTFEILTPPPEPPGVGWVNTFFLLIVWTVHDISRTFDFLTPLKFPLRPPPLGWGGQFFLDRNHPQICRDLCILNPFSDLFFAFKNTISPHFAGYASVALKTIWLHEPRDLIFPGPLITLLCLSRYSSMGEVLFTHADCRRM